MEQIDIVIPYVNNQDLNWQKDFNIHRNATGDKDARRFRDANAFHYWFRSIERTLTFNYRIVLILASEAQCPRWLYKDHERLKIVYHKDFIPSSELPTFNSSVINCYIPFIKGLHNKYVLYNDDMFNIRSLNISDFYHGNMPSLHYEHGRKFNPIASTWDANIAKCQNEMNAMFNRNEYVCPEHCPLPHIRTLDLFLWDELPELMKSSLTGTPFRLTKNVTDWIYQIFYLYLGMSEDRHATLSHYFNNENISIPTEKIACYNDTERIKNFELYKTHLHKILHELYPQKSTFEV